jgi:hypothetical protein
MSPSQRKTLIRKDHTALSLTRQCKLLRISRSSLYYTPAGINAETLKLIGCLPNIRSLAAARLQLTCQDTGSTQAVIACVA